MSTRGYTFVAGEHGDWHIEHVVAVAGEGLAPATRLAVIHTLDVTPSGVWQLAGMVSNERYVTRTEKTALLALPPAQTPTRAALIALRKSDAWWALTQDERRAVFETHSRHIALGLEYGAGIARRLHHCRDMREAAPFDFLTWFEYAPQQEARLDALLSRLRASEEWRYVEREVDVRLSLAETVR